MKKRTGGLFGDAPEVFLYIIHSIFGHPVDKINPYGLYGFWCRECGATVDAPE